MDALTLPGIYNYYCAPIRPCKGVGVEGTLTMKCGMSVWVLLALAVACRAELQLSQQGRKLQQDPKSSVQWYDLHSTYVAAAEEAVGQVRRADARTRLPDAARAKP